MPVLLTCKLYGMSNWFGPTWLGVPTPLTTPISCGVVVLGVGVLPEGEVGVAVSLFETSVVLLLVGAVGTPVTGS